MTWGQPVGLNELMIINPGLPGRHRYVRGRERARRRGRSLTSGDLYLSDDGEVFRVLPRWRSPCDCPSCRLAR